MANGKDLGQTPLVIEEVKPGDVTYELRLSGHKQGSVSGKVEPQQQTFLAARLEKTSVLRRATIHQFVRHEVRSAWRRSDFDLGNARARLRSVLPAPADDTSRPISIRHQLIQL
jgi:hypothetical protein